MSSKQQSKQRWYVGIDVGGTKILASLVAEDGAIQARQRLSTPRDLPPEGVVDTIAQAVETLLTEADVSPKKLAAIGIAIPGVVDPACGLVVMTPNMNLTGMSVGPILEERFGVPVALGNDCNLGTLGETWLGSARGAKSAVSILVGTGIGSGIVQNGRLWTGARESAGEIGHIIMEIGGPQCGCGNHGCFEALASRTAIERQLREGIDAGRESLLPELVEGNLNLIRSSVLQRGLEAKDELVTEVMRRASVVLGNACLTVRHLFDPEVIVLGGGVVEACGDFILPIVEEIVHADKLAGAREGGGVRLSALGDDAVVLGGVALARLHVDRSPFDEEYASVPTYQEMRADEFGSVTLGEKRYDGDILVRVNGRVKKRKKETARKHYGSSHVIGPKELERVCRGGPEVLFVGTGHSGQTSLHEDGVAFLERRAIKYHLLSTPEMAEAYNQCPERKAALIHVTC